MSEVCPECRGRGIDPADDFLNGLVGTEKADKCPRCKGTGRVSIKDLY